MKMKVVISETGFFFLLLHTYIFCSWWLYGLSHGSAAVCLLGLQVWIPLGHGCLFCWVLYGIRQRSYFLLKPVHLQLGATVDYKIRQSE